MKAYKQVLVRNLQSRSAMAKLLWKRRAEGWTWKNVLAWRDSLSF